MHAWVLNRNVKHEQFSHVPPGFGSIPLMKNSWINSSAIELDVIKDVGLYNIEPHYLQELLAAKSAVINSNQGGSIVKWNTTTWKWVSSKHIVGYPIFASNVSDDEKFLSIKNDRSDCIWLVWQPKWLVATVMRIEHLEIEEKTGVHMLYKDLIYSGLVFGAERWVACLE